MSGRNFSLTERLSEFIDAQVAAGRHHSASEVVREALRRYQHEIEMEQAQVEAIKELVKEGRDAKARGDFVTIRGPEDAAKLYEEMTGRVATWLIPAPSSRV
jgi:antitoxin ParD1/3/4